MAADRTAHNAHTDNQIAHCICDCNRKLMANSRVVWRMTMLRANKFMCIPNQPLGN